MVNSSSPLALNLQEIGKLALVNAPIHVPEDDEIIIKVESAGLAPVDAILAAGQIPLENVGITSLPIILSLDPAGVVHSVGKNVTNVKVGDRVFGHGQPTVRNGALQHYAVNKGVLAAKLPDSISFDQAAAFPLQLATAALGLYGTTWSNNFIGGAALTEPWAPGGKDKYKGQAIFITNGASSVGIFAIQLAKLSGFSVIVSTSSEKNFDYVKSFGATHVLSRELSADNLLAQAREIIGDKAVPGVLDIVSSSDTLKVSYELISPGGIIAREPWIGPVEDTKNKNVKSFTFYGSYADTEYAGSGEAAYQAFSKYLASGDLRPPPITVVPGGLNGVEAAFEKLNNKQVSASKLVVHPFETVV